MAEAKRPLPTLSEPDTRPFWEATRRHELRFQRCNACRGIVFYPRSHCTHCLSRDLAWELSTGVGTIYTFSVVRRAYDAYFRGLAPYAVAWIDLDEGFRMMSNVVGVADPSRDLRIGQRVRVRWEDHEELSVPLFEPA